MTELTSKKVLITLSVICLVCTSFSAIFYILIISGSGNYQLFTMSSGSMEPTIMSGEIVLIDTNINPETLRTFYPDSDIILFKKPSDQSELILHRIVYTIEGEIFLYFYTKGDGNSATKYPDLPSAFELDPWYSGSGIPESFIVGKFVDSIIPALFLVAGFWVLIIVSIIAGLSVVVLIIKNKLNSRQTKMRQLEDRISELEKENK